MAKIDNKLSPLAKKLEVTLRKVLDSIAKDFDAVEKAGIDPKTGEPKRKPQYTLTDFMKVADRGLKLEAIRNSVKDDDEGKFFTDNVPEQEQQGADDDDDDE